MQKFAYIGTLTFNSLLTLEMKHRHIEMFHKRMSKLLRHTSKSEYWLRYVMEYHKVCKGSDQDDPESPHLHFILYSDRYLSGVVTSNIIQWLRSIGRSQFYLATSMKLQHYSMYISKDVEKNDSMYGISHDITVRLEEVDNWDDMEYWESPVYYVDDDDY